MEAKKSFAEDSTSGSLDKQSEEMDPSILTTFLDTCMKLLQDSKVLYRKMTPSSAHRGKT